MSKAKGNTLCLEYSPTSRATCQMSGSMIAEGAIRVAKRVRSGFHDGFDTSYILAERVGDPGFKLNSDREAYDGWRALRSEDQKKFLSVFGQPGDEKDSKVLKEITEKSDKLWRVSAELKRVSTAKNLKAVVQEITGNEWSKPNSNGLISRQPEYLVADVLAHGLMPACSYCKSMELINEYGLDGKTRTYCNGFFGSTRCEFNSFDFNPQRSALDEATAGPATVELLAKLKKSKCRDILVSSTSGSGGPVATSAVTESEQAVEDLPAPKKGRTAKQIFDEENGKALQEANELSSSKVKTLLTKMWKELPADQKTTFQDRAKQEAEEYSNAMVRVKEAKALAAQTNKALKDNSKGGKRRGNAQVLDEPAEKKQAGASDAGDSVAARPQLAPFHQGSASLRVDESFSGSGQIYLTDNGTTAWSVKLNQTDLDTGVNKYYVLQVITSGKQYYFFTKWGRTGERSRMMNGEKTERFSSPESAMQAFEKKFQEKTGRSWSTRDTFQQKGGMYSMLMQDREGPKAKSKAQDASSTTEAPRPSVVHISKLDPRVRRVVSLIFDKQMQSKALQQQNVDLEKMPLGSLSNEQLLKGYKILSEISDMLEENKEATADARLADNLMRMRLKEATTRFYTTIPHSFSLNAVPPVIADHKLLQKKVEMMEALLAGNDAATIIKASEEKDTMHCDDANYIGLKCKIEPVEKDSEEYNLVKEYLANTQSQQHKRDFSCELEDLYRLEKEGDDAKFHSKITFGELAFTPSKLHNRRLLWHGSRLTNWAGILSQGLRIAPPEAPVTGYMFDKGVYFADMASKSAQYCSYQIGDRNPCGFLALCEVALGDQLELTRADEQACKSVARAKKHSCWGMGAYMPGGGPGQGWNGCPQSPLPELKDVMIPSGPGCDTNATLAGMQPGQCLTNDKAKDGNMHTDLKFNEFIVYRTEQIRFKYLVKATFHYKDGRYDWNKLNTTTGVEFDYPHAVKK